MGDLPPDAGIGPTGRVTTENEAQLPITQIQFQHGSQVQSGTPDAYLSFHTQLSSLPSYPQRVDPSRLPPQHGLGSFNPQGGQHQHGSTFNMGVMAGALPDYGATSPSLNMQSSPHQQMQRRLSGASTPAVVYQLQRNLQYSQVPPGLTNPTSYGNFAQNQYGGAFAQAQGGHQQSFGLYGSSQQRISGIHQPFPPYPQLFPQQYYFPQGQQPTAFVGQIGHFPGPYGGRPDQPNLSPLDTSALRGTNLGESSGVEGHSVLRQGPETSLATIPRGPPRKPKQSGHALWVGNLPPGATVMDLKDHFSREATKDIESLFLISKSNCAFVNYRTEAACAAAMQRFHDSRFQGVRLVCRLRRSSAPSSGTPTGPSAMTGRPPSQSSSSKSPLLGEPDESLGATQENVVQDGVETEASSSPKVPEKFFVVKSLTLQDLEQSVRTGIWATQAHNEEILNKAYQAAENVYLIFSANKSGEYFGYARMLSSINEDAKEVYRSLPQPEAVETSDAPKSIPTPATEAAPKGHIIDDSARGTIFWEAEHSDEEEVGNEEASEDPVEDVSSQVWGKPFKVGWLSTNRLPFHRTRGLRNPWNANREVKIARDGTELEPSVGKRLVQMFHRVSPPTTGIPFNLAQMPVFMGTNTTQQFPPSQ